MERVSLNFGEVHPFWDVSMSPRIHKVAGVSREEMSSISIMVDAATGDVSLNAGYEPGSKQARQEEALYAEVEDDVLEALVKKMYAGRLEDPAYDAFKARQSSPKP